MNTDLEICKSNNLEKETNKNKDKKIVFFDIDDTLYSPKLGVTDKTKQAIKKLRENGHLAFICTGRSKAMIFPFILDVGFDGIIAGAGTYAEYDGKVLMRHDMDEEVVARDVRKLRECGFKTVPEGHDFLYYENMETWDDTYKAVYGLFMENIGEAMREIPADERGMCAAKISSVFTKESQYEKAQKVFEGDYTVVNHGNLLLELIPKGFSKAEGIKKIIELLNIPHENTYAIGDSMNDYEMIEFVKHGIAMGNSDERIVKIADFMTETIENEGVYKALLHFGLI